VPLAVDDDAVWDQLFSAGLAAPNYLGLSNTQAEEQAAAEGVTTVRVVDPDVEPEVILTFDLRPDRLTLLVRHGHVVRSGFF
jgi:hypothetical protein